MKLKILNLIEKYQIYIYIHIYIYIYIYKYINIYIELMCGEVLETFLVL